MSNFKKILAAILCVVIIACSLVGCGEKYMDAIIYFELAEKPQTLDPQTAQSDSELLIVRNIYEGLMREDAEGSIVSGVAEKCSYENLTYTFNLRSDAVWSNGEKVTAYDFQYGFQRAVDPKIKAPFVSRLYAIKNAEQIANGSADVSTLGVSAVDENTLTITLCREDNDFLKTLTTSICMPCNEEFFESSIGKYGLDSECIISNGSYRLTKWNKEDFGIRIYKNEEYSGTFEAQNAAVFISCIDSETQVSRLNGGQSDMAFIGGSELPLSGETNLCLENVQNTCWIMTISNGYPSEVRKAFAHGFSTDVYKNSLPQDFSIAKSLYPEILDIDAEGVGVMAYDIDLAKTIMSSQIATMQDKKFPPSTMYYYNENGVKELATAIVGHWQQNFSTFINIEASENLPVLQNEIGESTLDFALFPIKAKSNNFTEYAEIFSILSNVDLPDGLQQELLANHTMIPVAYQSTNISYIASLENVNLCEDNGYIDFSDIIKR